MTFVTRLGDVGSGHACHFPPTKAVEGSPDVTINGKPAVRVGDAYAPHACPTCPEPKHGRKLASGSPTVFVNGLAVGRIGDAIDCGGEATTGSSDVILDGG